eukprot:8519870-Alexandrium_andersonii.AAC.1
MSGGTLEGVAYDPVSYIVAGLQRRFAQLVDETRLVAATQLQAFARHPRDTRANRLTQPWRDSTPSGAELPLRATIAR